MKDFLISMFIDHELNLDEKIEFVETVHANDTFKIETIDLLQQEKQIRSKVVDVIPSVKIKEKRKLSFHILRPVGIFAAGLAAALLILVFRAPEPQRQLVPYRFVLFQPEARKVEIVGSFTGWNSMPMQRTGGSGYWEITLELPQGEHRFSYILEDRLRLPDPTIMTRERDDFGGENSVLELM